MKLVPCKISEAKAGRIYNDNYATLMEFLNGEHECCRVMNFTQKTAGSCAGSLRCSIKRYGLFGIEVINRKGKVYLVKTTK